MRMRSLNLNMLIYFFASVKHGVEFAARGKVETNGGNCEELLILCAKDEDDQGERSDGQEGNAKHVSRTIG